MDVPLRELVGKWRGRHAVLEIDIARSDGCEPTGSFHYEGILDGPYINEGPGVGFMLGSDVISGDIAIRGPFVDFELEDSGRCSTPILGEQYVELRPTEMPVVAEVFDDEATWELRLRDGGIARCRLRAPEAS